LRASFGKTTCLVRRTYTALVATLIDQAITDVPARKLLIAREEAEGIGKSQLRLENQRKERKDNLRVLDSYDTAD